MQTLTALLLLLGLTLAPAGTFTYVWVAMTDPDEETLRIAKSGATVGRWAAATGTVLYLIHAFATGATTGPATTLVLMLAACAALASHLTKLRPPQTPRPV